jgi:uncharacterized membrane protein
LFIYCPRCGRSKEVPDGEEPRKYYRCTKCSFPIRLDAASDLFQPDEELIQSEIGADSGTENSDAGFQNQLNSLTDDLNQAKQVLIHIENRLNYLQGLHKSTSGVESNRIETQPTLSVSRLHKKSTLSAIPTTRKMGTAGPRSKRPHESIFTQWFEMEQAIPGNWLARIGIIALFIAVGFFLKLAFDNDWIGDIERVVLGGLIGLALLGTSEFWLERYRVWAQALAGGGIAIIYLSIFAAFALYDLIGFIPAFVLMFLTTAAAAGLALRQESMAIAILGITGAFATPIILGVVSRPIAGGDGGINPDFLIAYILVLDLGILGMATFRNWRWLNLLGLLGSLILFAVWYVEYGEQSSLLVAELSLTAIFLIFVAATSLFHILWRRKTGPADIALMAVNALAYYSISHALLWDDYQSWFGGFTLILAIFYGVLGYAAFIRLRDNLQLSWSAIVLTFLFFSIAIPMQFEGPWIAVAWAAEAALLLLISSRYNIWFLRAFSLLIFSAMMIRLWSYDAATIGRYFSPVLNYRFLAYVSSIVSLYTAIYILHRIRSRIRPNENWILPTLVVAANILTIWIFSLELTDYFDSENATNLSLTVLWALYALAVVIIGIWRQWRWVRLGGLYVLVIAIVKVFAYDLFALGGGYRIAAFASLGIILITSGFLYQRYTNIIKKFILE